MKKTLFAVTVTTLAAAISANVEAATFTNATAFFTAISGQPSYTQNYSGVSPWGEKLNLTVLNFTNGSNFGFSSTLTNTSAPASFWGDTYSGMRALSDGFESDIYVLTNFSLNTFAFGGYFAPVDGVEVVGTGSMSLSFFFSDSTTTNVTLTRASTNLNDWFFGWVTDTPGTSVRSVTLDAGTIDYGTAGPVTLAVPEPSTYALLTLAAAGLAGYVIRRRRS